MTAPIAAKSVAEVTVHEDARETDAAISALAIIVPTIVRTQMVELNADVMLCGEQRVKGTTTPADKLVPCGQYVHEAMHSWKLSHDSS